MDKINSVTLANKVPTPMTRAPFTHFGGGFSPPQPSPAYATGYCMIRYTAVHAFRIIPEMNRSTKAGLISDDI